MSFRFKSMICMTVKFGAVALSEMKHIRLLRICFTN